MSMVDVEGIRLCKLPVLACTLPEVMGAMPLFCSCQVLTGFTCTLLKGCYAAEMLESEEIDHWSDYMCVLFLLQISLYWQCSTHIQRHGLWVHGSGGHCQA